MRPAAAMGSGGGDNANAAIDPVTAARQQFQKAPRFARICGLADDAPADADHGIGAEHEGVRVTRGDGGRFGLGQAAQA